MAAAAQDGGERHSYPILVTVEIGDKAAVRDYAAFRRVEGKRRHDRDSDSPFSSFVHPKRLGDIAVLLDGSEVRLIRVNRYAARTFSSAEAVRQKVLMLWDLKVGEPQEMMSWAEATDWTLDSTVELKNGRTAKLVTDGHHFLLRKCRRIPLVFPGNSAALGQR